MAGFLDLCEEQRPEENGIAKGAWSWKLSKPCCKKRKKSNNHHWKLQTDFELFFHTSKQLDVMLEPVLAPAWENIWVCAEFEASGA